MFSIFKAGLSWSRNGPNTKFSVNIRISLGGTWEVIWLEGKWDGLRFFSKLLMSDVALTELRLITKKLM